MMTMTPNTIAADHARLLAEANQQHAAHPQYAGHWDGWVVATARRDIKQRGVLVLRKGERCLLDPASLRPAGGDEAMFCTVYLAAHIGGCDTARRASDFDTLG